MLPAVNCGLIALVAAAPELAGRKGQRDLAGRSPMPPPELQGRVLMHGYGRKPHPKAPCAAVFDHLGRNGMALVRHAEHLAEAADGERPVLVPNHFFRVHCQRVHRRVNVLS